MILYLQATTNVQDLIIDYIEVKLKSGKTVNLNWDESGTKVCISMRNTLTAKFPNWPA